MQMRGLLAAAILLAVLAGGVWWSNRHPTDEPGTESSGVKVTDLKAADLTRIEIRRAGGETTILERKGDEWALTSPSAFPVDAGAAATLAGAVAAIEAEKVVEEKVADFAQFGLKEPRFDVVVATKDSKMRTVQLGDESPVGSSWFARLAGDDRLFALSAATKGAIDKSAADLRDKRLLTLDEGKLARIDLIAKGVTTELTKNSRNEWQISKPQVLRTDGGHVEEVLRRLREAQLDPHITAETVQKNETSFAASLPFVTVVAAAEGSEQRLEVRKTGDNRYLARSSAAQGVHALANDAAEGLAKDPASLRTNKIFDFRFDEPSRVDYKDAQSTRSLVKTGERWLESDKELDSVGVQSLIDRLRDLSASKFPTAGAPAPEIEITVVSDSGKRTEKILIGKSGSSWIARRDGEAPLYEIDDSTITALRESAQDVKVVPEPPKTGGKK